jgi:hypothetical protein
MGDCRLHGDPVGGLEAHVSHARAGRRWRRCRPGRRRRRARAQTGSVGPSSAPALAATRASPTGRPPSIGARRPSRDAGQTGFLSPVGDGRFPGTGATDSAASVIGPHGSSCLASARTAWSTCRRCCAPCATNATTAPSPRRRLQEASDIRPPARRTDTAARRGQRRGTAGMEI